MSEENGSNKIGTGTAEGLMEFFDFLVSKGYATPAAVTPLKSASRQVLIAVDGENFDEIDVRTLDPEEYLGRFENMVVGQYKQESLHQYRNRFKRGLSSYLTYLDEKRVPSFRSGSRRKETDASRRSSSRTPATPPSPTPPSERDRLIDYPFPLRSGQIAILRLPVGLEKTDADRMAAYIRTLVLDPQLELTSGDEPFVGGAE